MNQGQIKEFTITPADFGLVPHPLSTVAGGSPLENAATLNALFNNEVSLDDPVENFVVMNTAALLLVAGKVNDLIEGVEKARESIRSGGAKEALNTFREEAIKAVISVPDEDEDEGYILSPPRKSFQGPRGRR